MGAWPRLVKVSMIAALVAVLIAPLGVLADDVDQDGIADADEQLLLGRHSPYWIPHDNGQRPPLPLDWYVRQCQLRWYDRCANPNSNPGRRLGDTGNRELTLEYLASYDYGGDRFFRLGFKDAGAYDYRNGQSPNPADRITWSGLQGDPSQRVVFGRVARVPGSTSLYTVMYFLFFGNNVTDTPNHPVGPCTNYGTHEGDIIGLEFTVYSVAIGSSSQIVSAVYNNHGRKIFIDDAAGLEYRNRRPIAYLEREAQEPWPVRGTCGFPEVVVPSSVGINRNLNADGQVIMGWQVGFECQDWQICREHLGGGTPFVHTNVVNLGERRRPMDSAEARFLDRFGGTRACGTGDCDRPPNPIANAGRFGDFADDLLCICLGGPLGDECYPHGTVDSPMGPSAQDKMWNAHQDEYIRADSDFLGRVQKVTGVQLDRDPTSPCTIRITVSTRNPGPAVVQIRSDNTGLALSSPSIWIPPGQRRGSTTATLDLTEVSPDVERITVSATAVPPSFHTPPSQITNKCGEPQTYAQAFPLFSRSAVWPVRRSVTELDATRTSDTTSPISVRWQKVCGATEYGIYCDGGVFPIAVVPDQSSLWLSYVDRTSLPCLAHRYQVEARFSNGPAPLSPIVVGFAGLAFKDIVLSTDFLQGRGSYSGRVELWGAPATSSTIALGSTNPGLLQVPFSVNMPANSAYSAFFPVENYPNLCPPPIICEPTQVLLSAESESCRISKAFWVQPTDTWPELLLATFQTIATSTANPPQFSDVRHRLADLNMDGLDDLIWANSIGIYMRLSAGGQPLALLLQFGTPLGDPWWFEIMNADGNSFPDILVDTDSGALLVIRDAGSTAPIVGPVTDYPLARAIDLLTDFNGDGLDDFLYVVHQGAWYLDVRTSTGTGLFSPVIRIPLQGVPPASSSNSQIDSGFMYDINSDGYQEMILRHRRQIDTPPYGYVSTFYVFQGSASGIVSSPDPTYTVTFSPQDIRDVKATDVDGDGRTDLVLAKRQLVHAPSGTLLPPAIEVRKAWGETDTLSSVFRLRQAYDISQIELHDLDGDGRRDIMIGLEGVAGGSDQLVQVFRQREFGQFSYPGDLATDGSRFAIGDADGDGDNDPVIARTTIPMRAYFNMTNPPAAFQLNRPADGVSTATGSVQFAWGPAPAAESYTIQVARDGLFNQVVASTTTAQTSATLTLPLVHEGRFYWRVTAMNPQGTRTAHPGLASFEMYDLNTIDCNHNGRYDSEDIRLGTSLDTNGNSFPDECERCRADINADGTVTLEDLFSFLEAWFSRQAAGDIDRDGSVSIQDIFEYLNHWFTGC